MERSRAQNHQLSDTVSFTCGSSAPLRFSSSLARAHDFPEDSSLFPSDIEITEGLHRSSDGAFQPNGSPGIAGASLSHNDGLELWVQETEGYLYKQRPFPSSPSLILHSDSLFNNESASHLDTVMQSPTPTLDDSTIDQVSKDSTKLRHCLQQIRNRLDEAIANASKARSDAEAAVGSQRMH